MPCEQLTELSYSCTDTEALINTNLGSVLDLENLASFQMLYLYLFAPGSCIFCCLSITERHSATVFTQ